MQGQPESVSAALNNIMTIIETDFGTRLINTLDTDPDKFHRMACELGYLDVERYLTCGIYLLPDNVQARVAVETHARAAAEAAAEEAAAAWDATVAVAVAKEMQGSMSSDDSAAVQQVHEELKPEPEPERTRSRSRRKATPAGQSLGTYVVEGRGDGERLV